MAQEDPSAADVERLLQRGADLERKLYKRERRAERELAELQAELVRDQARLKRATLRVERRLADIARAEAALRSRQEERATGRATDTTIDHPPAPPPNSTARAEPDSSDPRFLLKKQPRPPSAPGEPIVNQS